MTLSKVLWSLGLAAGVAGATPPTYVTPYSPAPVVSTPAGPGCAAPTLPGTVMPSAPGTIVPGVIAPAPIAPGVASPTAPSSLPTAPSPSASAPVAVPGAGVAASGSELATGGGEGGSDPIASVAPNMIGDLGIKGFYRDARLFSIVKGKLTNTGDLPCLALVSQGQFRIIENESPRPQDRVSLTLNQFDNVGGKLVSGSAAGSQDADLFRATVSFEKTFLGGNASFGARVPIFYRDAAVGGSVDGFGDVTLIGKYAFINDPASGLFVSGGLAVTVPVRELPTQVTATDVKDINSVLLQPFVGFLLNGERFYVQGFASYVAPTNQYDTFLIGTDIGVGYKAYQNPGATLSAVIPTLEVHVLNPLNNRSIANTLTGYAPVGFTDQVMLTGGVHLGLGSRTFLTLAYGTVVTGPRLFSYEATAQLNFGF